MHVCELTEAARHQFTFFPIGEGEEHDVKAVITKDFQEDWFTQQSDKRLSTGEEVVVRLISDNEAKINIGIVPRSFWDSPL